jgi:hypothetical protein
MSPDARLSDAEFVHALERRATIAADHAEAILADQRLCHRLRALRTIKHRLLLVHLSIIAVSLTGCLRFETAEPAIGEAYIAPATLQLREEIAPRAQVTATLQHGARVEILARHRRFAKVRTAAGVTGWTDGRQLLSAQGMAIFRNQTVRASAIPPQGFRYRHRCAQCPHHAVQERAEFLSALRRGTRPTRWPLDDAADTVCAAG